MAVMGQFGAGLPPMAESITRLDCVPGMVLGKDNICYNKSQLRNADRKWPKGRAPLLTGGERNAITTAARASRKIQTTTKQLQRLGMLPKPSRRGPPKPRQAPLALPPGTTIVQN